MFFLYGMVTKTIPCQKRKVAAGKPGARADPNQFSKARSPKGELLAFPMKTGGTETRPFLAKSSEERSR